MSFTFKLNGKNITVKGVSPTTTVLEWLRSRGETGTKEGCAEGDCGACSVAMLDTQGPRGPTWRSVCSCIMFLPQAAGRELVTVEGLADRDGLHPAQSAMVEHLGSQCGYCTPGFVMSLFEGTYRCDLDQPWKKDDQICGNLCRCTGYRPIRDALEAVGGTRPADRFSAALEAPGLVPPVDYTGDGARFLRPTEWASLWDALDDEGARIVSGATDLGLDVTQRHQSFPVLIDIGQLPKMRRIEAYETGWRVGAGVILSDLEAWSENAFPMMCKMLRFFASRQIKNRATLGGNLCNASPIGDLPPVLMALGAHAVIRSRDGERRVSFAGDTKGKNGFWRAYRATTLKPGEVLAAVEIPDKPVHCYGSSYKVSKRRELDISAVSSAFVMGLNAEGHVDSVTLAYGGMAATPSRAIRAEHAFLGHSLSAATIEKPVRHWLETFRPSMTTAGARGIETRWRRTYFEDSVMRCRTMCQFTSLIGLPQP